MAVDIMSMDTDELKSYVTSIGEPQYRASQLYSWLMDGVSPDEMTNLPKRMRERISADAEYTNLTIAERQVSKTDGTIKYLFRLYDGECIESVFMKYEHGNTVCVSSQVGCRMGCRFCASTIAGRVRDLAPGEILAQVTTIQHDTNERIGGIVMMGIGEPLDNYDATVKFLRLVSAENGLNIGLRHISVSTCGIVPGIDKLADEGLPVTLSLSLHACTDERRSAIMPINKKYPIAEVLAATRRYFDKTGRRVSFEYTLINGENDSPSDAKRLAALLRREIGGVCHVNLILLNPVDERAFTASAKDSARAFCDILNSLGVTATVRRRLGSDIDAACGQLRRRNAKSTEVSGTDEILKTEK